MKKQQERKSEYEVDLRGAAEYVIVRCPEGHRSRALKGKDDMKIRQEIVCSVPRCSAVWMALVPMNNGFEADE